MIGELFVKIGADFKDLEKGFENAQKKIDTFAKNTEKLGKGFIKNVSLPIVGAVTGIVTLGVKASQTADRIDKMSQKLGLSRDTFQKYDFILSQSGTSVDSMGSGMKKLTENIAGVLGGVDGATDNFKRLGVEVVDVNGNVRNQEDVFEDLIKSFQSMENGVEKTKMAQEVFGRAGQELLPLLNQQSGSLEELEEKYESLGIAMSDDAVDAGVKFTDTLDQLKRSFSASFSEIGTKFLPLLSDTLVPLIETHIIPLIDKLIGFVEKWTDKFMALDDRTKNIILAVIGFIAILGPVILIVSKIIAVFSVVITVFKVVAVVIAAIFSPIGLIIAGIVALIAIGVLLWKNWDTVKQFAINTWEYIKNLLQTKIGFILAILSGPIGIGLLIIANWELIKQKTTEIFTAIKNKMNEIWTSIIESIKTVINNIVTFIRDKFNSIRDTLFGIMSAIGSKIKETFNKIVTDIKNSINKVIDLVNGVISKFNGIKINIPKVEIPAVKILGFETPAFSVGGQSFGVPQIPSVPKLAEGGIINKPTLAMIGEGGESEAVIPLSKLAGLSGNNETHIYLDGKEITRAVAPQMVDMLRTKLAY
jgi:phage-related protein